MWRGGQAAASLGTVQNQLVSGEEHLLLSVKGDWSLFTFHVCYFYFSINKSPNFHKKKQGQDTMKSYVCLSWVWVLRPRSYFRDFLERKLEEVICMWQVQGCWAQGTQVLLVPGASKTSYLVSWMSPAGAAGGRKERQDIWFPRDGMLSRNAIWRNKIDFGTFFSPEINKRSE